MGRNSIGCTVPGCGKRHWPDHAHITHPETATLETDPAARIVGAQDSASLAEQASHDLAETKHRGRRRRVPELTPEQIREEEARKAQLLDLCRELVKVEATIPAMLLKDPRYYEIIVREHLESLAKSWQNVAVAYGVELAGPVTSILALAMVHLSVAQQTRQRIQQSDAVPEKTQ